MADLGADDIKSLLKLMPDAICGFVRETYTSALHIAPGGLPAPFADGRPLGTALYFMMTPQAPGATPYIPRSSPANAAGSSAPAPNGRASFLRRCRARQPRSACVQISRRRGPDPELPGACSELSFNNFGYAALPFDFSSVRAHKRTALSKILLTGC